MADFSHSDLLQYYKRELVYLRQQGANFSQRYPKVASMLALHGTESPDPHTERLIESVAFLAARVHQDLDREFPQVAAALLENLCPSLMQPIPAMTIVEFTLDPNQGKVMAGFQVAQHTALYATAADGQQCRFRTTWDTLLWPVRITKAVLDGGSTLHLTFECAADTDFSELEMDRLRLHLQGDWMTTMPLYEFLVADVLQATITPEDGVPRALPLNSWREVGYAEGENVLPLAPNAQPAYGLMQEYFAFPRKFHFFDLLNLRAATGKCQRFNLSLTLAQPARGVGKLSADNFRLGCTPIINIFQKTSEPILVDHQQFEYLLVSDRQRESSTEVHSIVSVTASDPNAERPVLVPNFAALGHLSTDAKTSFWSSRREHSLRKDISGTDVFLSFVDQTNTLKTLAEPVVYANLLCTNRRLAEQVPVGARMVAEGISTTAGVRCLYEPTAQRSPPLGSETLWRLVSLLTLNHQSLVDGSTGKDQLREMLTLFASDSTRDHEQIRGIRHLQARSVTGRVGVDAWRGYCRGTEVMLAFDEAAFVGSSQLLLSAVLARFFALYTSVNSFVQIGVHRGDEVWKQWEPMSGRQLVL
ncbi:MAG: type VI secretion system protein ImpG [Rhodoferax sp.]|jgi:type VI secretion system protein ImpG